MSSPENYGTLQEINKEKRVKEEQGKHTPYKCIYYPHMVILSLLQAYTDSTIEG
jgi:hypothetical protein